MRIRNVIITLLLCAGMAGCAKKTYVSHPGSVNTFDSQSYDFLVSTKAVIDQTKADLAAGVFPPSIAPAVKRAVNVVVIAYNVADTTYQAYHAAGASATAAQANAVSASQATVSNALTNLTAAKGGSQ